jgi:AraC-like DNA-binding protein/quercetin dioxygenase-like cupin family protein
MNTAAVMRENDPEREDSVFRFRTYNITMSEKTEGVREHWHNELEIIIIGAKAVVTIDGEKISIGAGDILFIAPGKLHSIYALENGSCLFFVFSIGILTTYETTGFFDSLAEGKYVIETLIARENPASPKLHEQLQRLYDASLMPPPGAEFRIRAVIYEILYQLCKYDLIRLNNNKDSRQQSEYIKAAIEYINENYSEPISADDVAVKLSLSRAYFHRLFRQYTNQTPNEYINRRRMEEARRLLESGASVSEAAQSVGISGAGYFIKRFKQYYGITPSRIVK